MKNLRVLLILMPTLFWVSCGEDDQPIITQVTITNPADGSALNTSVTIKVEVTPSDIVESVSFLIDGEIIGEDVTVPYEHLWHNFMWSDGNLHSISAKAKNIDGTEKLSNALSVRVSEDFINVIALPEDGQNVISWEPIEGALSYNLYWSEVSGGTTNNGTKLEDVTSPYTHEGLINGTTYYYIMTAVFTYGESDASTEFGAVPGTPPSIPANVIVSPEDNQNVISWGNAIGAETYNIYWSESSGFTTTNGLKLEDVTSPNTHPGLTNGTNYFYIVTAVNVYGESNASNEVNAIPGSPPSIPTNVSVLPEDSRNVISWDNSDGAVTYNIYWIESSGVTVENGTKITDVASPYIHTGLTNGVNYHYIITAVNEYGESDASGEVNAKPGIPPDAPQNVTAVAQTTGEIIISWDNVSDAATYNIYWLESTGVTVENGTKITNVASPYTHEGLTNGITYYYIIAGVNEYGEGEASIETNSTAFHVWITKTSMPTARFSLTTNSINGKIYAIGGWKGGYLTTVEEYDPSTDAWVIKTSIPTARLYHTSSVVNDKIYVIGGAGVNSNFEITTVEEYDPSTDAWSTKTSMPTARSSATSSVVNGKIYVIGGLYNGVIISAVEEYNPATDTWTLKNPMPNPRHGLTSNVVNGIIYVLGGYGIQDLVEEYDPSTDTWSTKTAIPSTRNDWTSIVVNGKIYVIGGINNSIRLSTVEEYDPITDSWSTKTSMPTERENLASSVVNGKIYVIGGRNGTANGLSIVEEYDPSLDQ